MQSHVLFHNNVLFLKKHPKNNFKLFANNSFLLVIWKKKFVSAINMLNKQELFSEVCHWISVVNFQGELYSVSFKLKEKTQNTLNKNKKDCQYVVRFLFF